MVSEIKGLQGSGANNLSVGSHQQADRTEGQNKTAGSKANQSSYSPSNEVSITDTASKLRQLEAKIASQPVVDTQRVESIKKAISDGTYTVNASRTADKMAEFESLLSSKAAGK